MTGTVTTFPPHPAARTSPTRPPAANRPSPVRSAAPHIQPVQPPTPEPSPDDAPTPGTSVRHDRRPDPAPLPARPRGAGHTTADPFQLQGQLPEHQRICHLCCEIKSVAEISALLTIPLGVARILVADLAEAGLSPFISPAATSRRQPARCDTARKGAQWTSQALAAVQPAPPPPRRSWWRVASAWARPRSSAPSRRSTRCVPRPS